MPYSFPYILLVLFFLGVTVIQLGFPLDEKSRKFLNYFVIIAYILFFGYRGFIATDWINYYTFFKDLSTDFSSALNKSTFEPGFVVYSVLIKNFFSSYEAFQLINTLIHVLLVVVFIKRYLSIKYHSLAFAVFFVFNGFILETNLLRNFMAILIFLLSLPYIEKRKPIKYFSCILIGVMFHWTSILYAPLYFFLHKKMEIRFFLMIFIIGSFIYLIQFEYIKPIIGFVAKLLPESNSVKIQYYLQQKMYSGTNGLTFGYFERALIFFLILFYYKKITDNKSNVLFVNSFIIFMVLYLYFYEIRIVQERIGSNFVYSYWILIPLVIHEIEKNFKILSFLFISLLLIAKIHLATNYIFYDYDSFLFGNSKTHDERLDIYNKNKHIIEKE